MSFPATGRAAAVASSDGRDDSEQRRIYILGTGNIGTIVAHSLAGLPESIRPPITLLLHRQGLLDAWTAQGETIDLLRYPDGASQPRGGIDVELVEPRPTGPAAARNSESPAMIQNLIVSVLASQTINAMTAIRHRLGRDSSILFLQNGMGSADEATGTLFPSPETRPTFLQGIVLAGGWTLEPFVVRHAAAGTLPIAAIPQGVDSGGQRAEGRSKGSRYLLDVLSASPVLDAEEIEYKELLQRQLEKLVLNVMANPLTGILDQSNAVLQRPTLAPLISALIAETSSIIRALPELQDVPGLQERFAAKTLETYAAKMFKMVEANTSSMAQHLRMKKKTEIEYINGYLVKRATGLGVSCELNSMLRQLILTKEAIGLEKQA